MKRPRNKNRAEVESSSFKSEEAFHDSWALSIDVDAFDVADHFEACTAPENRFIISTLGDLRGKSILDLGCGAGESSVYFAGKGAQVTASDISSEMLNIACRMAKSSRVQIRTLKCTSDAIPAEDSSFDVVYAANLLHHVEMRATLREIRRVLKKGGIFASWDPLAHNPLINIYRKIATGVRTEGEHPLTDTDLKLFNSFFSKVHFQMTWFFCLWIFIKFFLMEGVSPNKERYWKKILYEHERLRMQYLLLEKIDQKFLAAFPFMKRYCWNVTVIAQK